VICTICNGTLVYNVPPKECYRCKGKGVVADGWVEPALPDLHHIRALAREVGYAISVHGSELRDYDLVATPWSADAVGNADLVKHLCAGIPAVMQGFSPKPHGRYAFTLIVDAYVRQIDLSVAPRVGDYPCETLPNLKQVNDALSQLGDGAFSNGNSQKLVDGWVKTIKDYIVVIQKGVIPTSWFKDF
jgi:hypothetical protein